MTVPTTTAPSRGTCHPTVPSPTLMLEKPQSPDDASCQSNVDLRFHTHTFHTRRKQAPETRAKWPNLSSRQRCRWLPMPPRLRCKRNTQLWQRSSACGGRVLSSRRDTPPTAPNAARTCPCHCAVIDLLPPWLSCVRPTHAGQDYVLYEDETAPSGCCSGTKARMRPKSTSTLAVIPMPQLQGCCATPFPFKREDVHAPPEGLKAAGITDEMWNKSAVATACAPPAATHAACRLAAIYDGIALRHAAPANRSQRRQSSWRL